MLKEARIIKQIEWTGHSESGGKPLEVHSLAPDQLLPLMERVRKFDISRFEEYLRSFIVNTFSELSEFVPSGGGAIVIDDPVKKRADNAPQFLTYVASFGSDAANLPGKQLPSSTGVIGESYTLGKSFVRKAEKQSPIIIDRGNLPKPVNSVITVPMKIENSVIGVLCLYNKNDAVGFTIRDLKLVEIFAGYISTSLQNAVDARKSQELSKKDDLTGLFNDRYFHRQLETEISRADAQRYPLSLIFLDLDNFKSVNDKYGHLVGSQTLKEIGLLLRDAVDLENATMARYGGDEYVIILPGLDLQGAMDTAERIRMMIFSKLFMIDMGEHDGSFVNFKGVVTCSVGVASLHEHVPSGGTLRERKTWLLKLADAAMYRSKATGKNCVCAADRPSQP